MPVEAFFVVIIFQWFSPRLISLTLANSFLNIHHTQRARGISLCVYLVGGKWVAVSWHRAAVDGNCVPDATLQVVAAEQKQHNVERLSLKMGKQGTQNRADIALVFQLQTLLLFSCRLQTQWNECSRDTWTCHHTLAVYSNTIRAPHQFSQWFPPDEEQTQSRWREPVQVMKTKLSVNSEPGYDSAEKSLLSFICREH